MDGVTLTADWGVSSVIGRRAHNQDRVAVALPWIFVLDGVGGTSQGGAAAQIALARLLSETATLPDIPHDARDQALQYLADCAHECVVAELASNGRSQGATTLTFAHLDIREDGNVGITLGAVGDSPAWILKTRSVPMRISAPPERPTGPNSIRHALGWATHRVSLQTLTVTPPFRLVLATDGVEAVSAPKRDAILRTTGTAQHCASAFTTASVHAGGKDNATAAVVDISTLPAPAASDLLYPALTFDESGAAMARGRSNTLVEE